MAKKDHGSIIQQLINEQEIRDGVYVKRLQQEAAMRMGAISALIAMRPPQGYTTPMQRRIKAARQRPVMLKRTENVLAAVSEALLKQDK